MSLNRMLLRLSAVAAAANFWNEPWPTLAERMVFDSKVEPIENFEVDIAYPTIVVYTDYDRNHIAHQDLPHTTRTMTITFELLMAVINKVSDNPDEGYQMSMPATDSQLEASLDVMEHQLFTALRGNNSAANLFNTIAYGMENIVSRRGATTEGGTKIAARQVTYEARVLQEMASPVFPAFAQDFMAELEASSGYEAMAPRIRQLYQAYSMVEASERLRQSMGWPIEAKNALGYPLPGAPILRAPVQWLDQHGQPL